MTAQNNKDTKKLVLLIVLLIIGLVMNAKAQNSGTVPANDMQGETTSSDARQMAPMIAIVEDDRTEEMAQIERKTFGNQLGLDREIEGRLKNNDEFAWREKRMIERKQYRASQYIFRTVYKERNRLLRK
jgi:hypothetical protein